MTKWMNIELSTERPETEILRTFLRNHNTYFETSGAGDFTHFEIKFTSESKLRQAVCFVNHVMPILSM